MPTNAEMFETMRNWYIWSGADINAREANADGHYSRAAEHRAFRDRRAVDPLYVLATTHDLIESLTASRHDITTEALLRGATWDQVAEALHRPIDEVQTEYTAMVGWIADARPRVRRSS